MKRVALVTAAAARDLDDDLAPLEAALCDAGAAPSIVEWDDASVDWHTFDLCVLRSTWDYTQRLDEFLRWIDRITPATRLVNPRDVVRWNTDKHYLAELDAAGVPTVRSVFVEPSENAEEAIRAFVATIDGEFVAKPSVGAGSRDAQRYAREDVDAAASHAKRLLDQQRSVLLQPYLARVDALGETALIFFDGTFSHAIRKGPLLRRGEGPTRALFAAEHIAPRTPDADERDVASRAIDAIPFAKPLLYARVDLIRGDDGAPRVLELELTEPSLFFAHAPRSVDRFAETILRHA